jgi:hypothetical protein
VRTRERRDQLGKNALLSGPGSMLTREGEGSPSRMFYLIADG